MTLRASLRSLLTSLTQSDAIAHAELAQRGHTKKKPEKNPQNDK